MVFTVFMPHDAPLAAGLMGEPTPFPAAYEEVGMLAAASLDDAYARGQNTHATAPTGSWNPQTPVRSLAPGDVLVDRFGHAWRIEAVGYRALPRRAS